MRLLRRPGADEAHAFRLPGRADLPTLGAYAAAAAIYVVIGVFETDFLLSWYVGAAYLLVVVWLVPAALRRLR